MKVPIRRVDKDLPLPEYKTPGAAAMDLAAREGALIQPHSIEVIPLNVSLKPPKGHFTLMAARSSLRKRGLMLANNVGILDEDYAGDGDEYLAALYNFTDVPVQVERVDRIVQIIVLLYDKVGWQEVETLDSTEGGGMGTTGIQ